ncbi:MAG TPA: hypothetical protein VMA71_06355 [Alloacidobacterium sp.]|nr:hypothetical protein [Alloacidobacterium sp.]
MLVEIAKPIALLLCILSLYAVFHTAFLIPGPDLQQRILDSLKLLALAAGIALVSGLLFSESTPGSAAHDERLIATLPMQVFLWAAGAMLVLFVVSWYLESGVFYRDIHPPKVDFGMLALLRR